nr:hypothetical protein [Tanacetum cinerariifolium]
AGSWLRRVHSRGLYSHPRGRAFSIKTRFQVIRRAAELRGRRPLFLLFHPPTELAVYYPKLLQPDPA